MGEVEDESVQTVVTSPPYYDLKDYGHEKEIGASDASYNEFQSRLSDVWHECYNKLKESGTMWVVADTTMDNNGNTRLLPYHIANRAKESGFNHINNIIWYKPTSLAGMNPKILANKKEYIILLSKSNKPKLDNDIGDINGLEDPAISSDNAKLGNLWRFPIKRGSLGGNILHKAPYPVDLAKRMIGLSTDPNDVVLDPFLGSGTTAQAALELQRRIVGYEINEDFKQVVGKRIEGEIDGNSKLYDWIEN